MIPMIVAPVAAHTVKLKYAANDKEKNGQTAHPPCQGNAGGETRNKKKNKSYCVSDN